MPADLHLLPKFRDRLSYLYDEDAALPGRLVGGAEGGVSYTEEVKMVVLIVTAVKPGLRGELSRWTIEPQAGVFVGNVAARIRDRLWERLEREVKEGSAVMAHSARTEQGFAVRVHGDRRRVPVDFEGITLILMRAKP